MKWIKSMKRCLLISFTAPLIMASGIAALEPGLPGTLIPGNRLFATGNNIWLQFLGGYAHYDVDLLFFNRGTSPIFNNHRTVVEGDVDRPTGSYDLYHESGITPFDDVYHATGFTPGEELFFGIFVQNTGETYYSGPAEGNPDNSLHVQFFEVSDGVYGIGVGFEDLPDGGDHDYQDIFFQIGGATVVPEPVTVLLLASGLLGVGGAGMLRRRRDRG